MLSVIIVSDYTYTRVHLLTITICTDDMIINILHVCYWLLLVCFVIEWTYFSYASMWILCNYGYIHITGYTYEGQKRAKPCTSNTCEFLYTRVCTQENMFLQENNTCTSSIEMNKIFVMLFTFKDNDITSSFYLCCLFYVLSVLIISNCICTRVQLYLIIRCTDGAIVYMCTCILLPIACAKGYWIYEC